MVSKENGLVLRQQHQALTPYTKRSAKEVQNIMHRILTERGTIDLSLFEVGKHRISCPFCAKKVRDNTLGITIQSHGNAVCHCFRCGFTQSGRNNKTTHQKPLIKAHRLPHQQHSVLSEYGRKIWDECHPLSGIAVQYLKNRKCLIPPADGDLRWHPELKHKTGHIGAALVGLVTHALSGLPISLHRTWIETTGKANIEPNRMLLGQHSAKHGVIRLFPDDWVTTSLGIAEGIETALSLAHEFRPVWAAISAGNMGDLPALAGIECLTIAVDMDDAGKNSATDISLRWHAAGINVRWAKPGYGNDLNDSIGVLHG